MRNDELLQTFIRPACVRDVMDEHDLVLQDVVDASQGELSVSTLWRVASGQTDNPRIGTLESITRALARLVEVEDLAVLAGEADNG